jgi:hypothetical protein
MTGALLEPETNQIYLSTSQKVLIGCDLTETLNEVYILWISQEPTMNRLLNLSIDSGIVFTGTTKTTLTSQRGSTYSLTKLENSMD